MPNNPSSPIFFAAQLKILLFHLILLREVFISLSAKSLTVSLIRDLFFG